MKSANQQNFSHLCRAQNKKDKVFSADGLVCGICWLVVMAVVRLLNENTFQPYKFGIVCVCVCIKREHISKVIFFLHIHHCCNAIFFFFFFFSLFLCLYIMRNVCCSFLVISSNRFCGFVGCFLVCAAIISQAAVFLCRFLLLLLLWCVLFVPKPFTIHTGNESPSGECFTNEYIYIFQFAYYD